MSINMSKIATGAAYGASSGTIAVGLLTRLSPDEWSAVGVLAGIVVAVITIGINWYYKRKATLAPNVSNCIFGNYQRSGIERGWSSWQS